MKIRDIVIETDARPDRLPSVIVKRGRCVLTVPFRASQFERANALRNAVGHVTLATDFSEIGDHHEDVVWGAA